MLNSARILVVEDNRHAHGIHRRPMILDLVLPKESGAERLNHMQPDPAPRLRSKTRQ